MPSMRALALAVIGLALPVGLALAAYASSAGSLAATPVVTPITGQLATPSKRPSPTTTSTQGTSTERTTTGTETEDRSGSDRCQEAEHRDDPECIGGSDDDRDDNSGVGGDDDDNSGSGSDNSGSGSDNSGHGGDDD